MIEIDGSRGGGQMLRNALSLSVIEQEPFRMENIRGSRSSPGLKRQHMEAVKVLARISGAKTEGLSEGSTSLEFVPRGLEPEPFTANIGTAGSTTLLLDAVMPVTTQFDDSFRLRVKGGTDVRWSPTELYHRYVKLPLLKRYGFEAELELGKTGFYPKGGGELTLETEPFSMQPVRPGRGELRRFEIYSKASAGLRDASVAERQAGKAAKRLKKSHISVPVEKKHWYEDTLSPGSSLLVKAVYEDTVAGFDALGEKGKRAEKVAEEAVEDFEAFHSTDANVDSHMADQLAVFLGVVGGEITVPEVTDHVQTGLEVVRKFGKEGGLDGRFISF
ncbi:MAG: RNA 3'-terminal phosphate cyclase [Candidatus Nanohaloarchaea archaeon]